MLFVFLVFKFKTNRMLLRSLRLFTSKVPASRPLINKTGKAKLSLTNKSVTDEDFRFSRLIKPFVFTASVIIMFFVKYLWFTFIYLI